MRIAWNSIGKTLASRRARAAVLAIIAFGVGCAGAAAALKPKADNWPNSPVRHTLKQHVRATVPSFSANLRGGVAVAGNTLETCPQNQPGNKVCAGNSYNNNDQKMMFVNVDPGTGADRRFNSSTATLNIPSGAHVIKKRMSTGRLISRRASTTLTAIGPEARRQVATPQRASRSTPRTSHTR